MIEKLCTLNFFVFIIAANLLILLYFSEIFTRNRFYHVFSNYTIDRENIIENVEFVTKRNMIYFENYINISSKNFTNLRNDDLPYCEDILVKKSSYNVVVNESIVTEEDMKKKYTWLREGGTNFPASCRQNQTVAIVVPFRNRPKQLLIFLNHMHPFLKKQNVNYTIFIIEQNDTMAFNRGVLMNIGYTEALKLADYSCFIFHDVDLLPEDERILYKCFDAPTLMCSAIDKYNYDILYPSYMGGVVSVNRELYKKINGFPNRYWGWGGEDDDFGRRFDYHNITRKMNIKNISHYKMLKHGQEKPNPERFKLLEKMQEQFLTDGLSNLKYNLTNIVRNLLYTKVVVNMD